MKCNHCGTENSEFAYKCVRCNKELVASTEVYENYKPDSGTVSENQTINNDSEDSVPEIPPEAQVIIDQFQEFAKSPSNIVAKLFDSSNQLESKKIIRMLITHIVLLFVLGSVLSIVGIIVSIISLSTLKNGDEQKTAKLTKANIVLTVLSVIFGIGLKFFYFFY